MISRKAFLAWVFSAVVGAGTVAMPGAALAHDWDHHHDGENHAQHDNGWHKGWRDNHRWAEEHPHPGYYQQPYTNNDCYRRPYTAPYRSTPPAYSYNQPGYGYNYAQPGYGYNYARPGYGVPSNGQGMVSPNHPGLMWTCDSDGHHCHWAARPGYSSAYPRTSLNPFAYGSGYNGYNGNGYSSYNNSNYANGYYGNSPMDGLGSLLGPMFGGQRP